MWSLGKCPYAHPWQPTWRATNEWEKRLNPALKESGISTLTQGTSNQPRPTPASVSNTARLEVARHDDTSGKETITMDVEMEDGSQKTAIAAPTPSLPTTSVASDVADKLIKTKPGDLPPIDRQSEATESDALDKLLLYTSEAITYSRQRRDAERKALAHKNQYKEYIKKDGVGSTNVEPFSPETQELWKRGKEEKAYGIMKSGRLEKEWLNGLIRLFGKEGGHRGEDQDMPNVVDEEVHPVSDEVDHHTRTLRERGKRLRRGPLGGPLVEMQGALQEIAARINEQGSSISNTPIHKDLGDEKGLSTEWTASTERNEVTRRIFSIVRRLEELEEGIEDAERWTTKTLESTKEALIAALDREIGRYMGKIGNKVGESQNMDVEQSDQLAANGRDIVLEETRSHRTSLRDSVLTADVYLRLIKGDMRPEQDVDIATGTDKLIANRTQLEVLDTELSIILGGVEKRHQSSREISKEEQSVLLSELMEAQNSAKLSSRIRPDATMAAPMPKLQDIVNQLQDRLTAQWASELQLLEVKAVESVERLNARAQRQQGMLEAEKDRRMGVLE